MEPVQRRELPWYEVRSKLVKKPISLREMKEWRTREADAGRPSSFEDLCRAFGLCVTCLGAGVTRNDNGLGFKVVEMDGDTQLFEQCPVCGGTGILRTSTHG
jgi:DnaJ-class molecular chaperone